jgi:carboxymethylenebutenolidase
MPTVTFPSNGSEATGYLAVSERGAGPALIVLQEWWGLDDHIRDVCDRLAVEGFFALAPDLYDGETTDQPAEAEQKMLALSSARAERDMRGAVDCVVAQDGVQGEGVGSLGFCMGGGLAVLAAIRNPKVRAAVTYYGRPDGQPDLTQIRGPVLGHFGTSDEFIPEHSARELDAELRRAGVDVRFEFYDAGHAFFNDTDRLGTYDPDAASRSWRLTVEFLRGALT